MKEYKFYGWEQADVPAASEEYKQIKNPRHLYDLLSEIWCADTCAPRMRDKWTKENMTLGQCSITAFLAQDIFGGDVYGILRPDGNYHCYNVAGDCVFDLTSEQFGDESLSYENNPMQSRDVHFAKDEKRLRYEYLKEELRKRLSYPECIHTVEEAIAYINEIGFLPLFKNDIPGFSLEERTVSEDWWSENPEHDPWEWREIIARSGQAIYGKFFDKKAGFISKEWFPYFANHRRDGYDFDARWDDEKASIRQKKIMDLFAEGNGDAELYSFEVKQNAGFGKDGEKNFEGTVTDLEMHMYLCMRDFRQKKNKKGESYGWSIAVYSTPEHLWGYDHVTSAYGEEAEKSWKRIVNHMNEIYPIATKTQILRVLGISKSGVSQRKKSNRTVAKDWIIPANPKYYDVIGAFEASDTVTWKQSSDVHVGDIIYMYVAAPYSSILYKCKAIEVDIPYHFSDENLTLKQAMKVKLLKKYQTGVWSFERIKQFGVYAVRGPRNMPAELKKEMESLEVSFY